MFIEPILEASADGGRDLATNIGIKFQTPEEFFLLEDTEPYQHAFEPAAFLRTQEDINDATEPVVKTTFKKRYPQELVIFCGSPGSGKSTFYWTVLQPQNYERVNQDILKSVCFNHARITMPN